METIIVHRKYIVKEFIGNGKFGTVFKGEKIKDSSLVAIKLESKTQCIPLLKHETRILEYLARNGIHLTIPQVYWYGLEDDYVCLVMPYFGESSLSKMILSIDEKKKWFQAAKSILEHIHLYGVIHRDLKPGHFLFYEGQWKLIDFGFATFISEEKKNRKEFIIGTPNYISISIHNGFEPGKKDDMISLEYIYLELLLDSESQQLPWANIPSELFLPNEYALNHVLHPTNQYRKLLKEKEYIYKDSV